MDSWDQRERRGGESLDVGVTPALVGTPPPSLLNPTVKDHVKAMRVASWAHDLSLGHFGSQNPESRIPSQVLFPVGTLASETSTILEPAVGARGSQCLKGIRIHSLSGEVTSEALEDGEMFRRERSRDVVPQRGNSLRAEAENGGILRLLTVEVKRKAPKPSPDPWPHPFNILFSGLGVWGSGGGVGKPRLSLSRRQCESIGK